MPQIVRPFVYGSSARLVNSKDTLSGPSHTHIWTIYLRGLDDEDISYLIERVEFKLHESFANSNRVCWVPPFEVTETGWGEFDVPITIYFKDTQEIPLVVHQMLHLYHKDNNPGNKRVIDSEKYDEFVFNSPSIDFLDALLSHPSEEMDRPKMNQLYTLEFEQKELLRIQIAHEKVLGDYESRRLDIAQLELEIRDMMKD